MERYYKDFSEKINSIAVANNITRISLKTSKKIINNVERIKVLTNQTLEDVRVNLDLISSALDGFSDLTQVSSFFVLLYNFCFIFEPLKLF